ncbi:DUF1800 domain-containing protein [Nocardioides agariphilus]|jgi:uncharacterized protein (DUF1800 family)|uniref:DUF1800 domain-containing protein n=1 Tax=Nocardioides agariphilus TaxID=433664 RepID=A0A930VNS4_9ACTN|nr:DUF1800 domain-containing protein [Nocardioides agariphilus]MBF4767215.1 DUF1800 domain-containing protein [Nocardioides agariphilus]
MTTPPPSRRALVGGALAASAVAAATSAPAYAASGSIRLLSGPDRHLVTRFSYGLNPTLAHQVRKAGGGHAWFERQLRPSTIADVDAAKVDTWWPELRFSPTKLWQRQIQQVQGGWEVMANYQRRALQRRLRTNRPVLEMMSEFWENHLNVPVNGDAQFTYRAAYGDMIRKHALGRFSDLLVHAITHPAMLIYLDQATSTKAHPNENLGRELLECHTVGRGHYTEDHVKASARILTGYTVDMWDTWQALYNPEEHWRGTVKVMGFRDANTSKDGRDLTRRYLRYLAKHPATARRIAWKLAVKFVKDKPSSTLVGHLAKVYLKNDTAIAPVLRALVASREFQRSVGAKVRDPGEDIVATYRLLGVRLGSPATYDAGVNAMLWQAGTLGITPLAWPRPDGQPIDNASWSSPARLMASLDMHYTLSGGWWPRERTHYIQPVDRLPAKQVRFDRLVDDLSRRILHRPASDKLLKACCMATAAKPGEIISDQHPVVLWLMPRLLTTILDSPDFMSR